MRGLHSLDMSPDMDVGYVFMVELTTQVHTHRLERGLFQRRAKLGQGRLWPLRACHVPVCRGCPGQWLLPLRAPVCIGEASSLIYPEPTWEPAGLGLPDPVSRVSACNTWLFASFSC